MRPLAGLLVFAMSALRPAHAPAQVPAAPQTPSPMVELSRAHERIAPRELPGTRRTFAGPMDKPVELFLPVGTRNASALHLLIHFHGDAFIPSYAASSLGDDHVVAVLNLGAGSGVYDRAFTPPATYDSLLASLRREVSVALRANASFADVTLIGFSAGHGAIRAILRDSAHFAQVSAVLLLDGMHTSYVPEGTAMAKGGTLDERNLEAWVRFGRAAMRGEKRFLVTHSEIFPGTFASTTETADYLLQQLAVKRVPVLKWGPRGTQQLSEAQSGQFTLLGFAGNAGPDHIDQLQGMPEFLRMLLESR